MQLAFVIPRKAPLFHPHVAYPVTTYHGVSSDLGNLTIHFRIDKEREVSLEEIAPVDCRVLLGIIQEYLKDDEASPDERESMAALPEIPTGVQANDPT